MKKIILLASHNKGKVAELQNAFLGTEYTIENLDFLPYKVDEVEETGITFEENALLKARFIAHKTGYIALADDSGLEVEKLQNKPGVYSARYAEQRKDLILQKGKEYTKDALNNLQLLKDMESFVHQEERKARFVCCLALVFPLDYSEKEKAGKEFIAHGYWNGFIAQEEVGTNGFGYDPLFFDASLGKMAAQLSKEEKLLVSHRGKALKNLLERDFSLL